MNLTEEIDEIFFDGKKVQRLFLDGDIVWTDPSLKNLTLTVEYSNTVSSGTHLIDDGGPVTVSGSLIDHLDRPCPNTSFEMTYGYRQTATKTITTNSNGLFSTEVYLERASPVPMLIIFTREPDIQYTRLRKTSSVTVEADVTIEDAYCITSSNSTTIAFQLASIDYTHETTFPEPNVSVFINFDTDDSNIALPLYSVTTDNNGQVQVTYPYKAKDFIHISNLPNDGLNNFEFDIPIDQSNQIELTSDRNIISFVTDYYYNNLNPVTLTAKLMGGTIYNQTITFQSYDPNDPSSNPIDIGEGITDKNGVASILFRGEGTGTKNIRAIFEGDFTFISNEITIEDYILYDDAISDKASMYMNPTYMTVSYNANDKCYEASSSSFNTNHIVSIFNQIQYEFDPHDDYQVEIDIKSDTTGAGFGAFLIGPNYVSSNVFGFGFYFKMWGTTTQFYTSDSSGQETMRKSVNHSRNNNWYTIHLEKNSNLIGIGIYQNNNAIFDHSYAFQNLSTTTINLNVIEHYASTTLSFKSIKIKRILAGA